MRFTKLFFPAAAMLLMASCSQRPVDADPLAGGSVGTVRISLSAGETKADVPDAVDLDAFTVEIFNSRKLRLFCDTYAQAKDSVIRLNAGDFRLLAKYGDSLGVGFGKPFYMADQNFTVSGGKGNAVSATAKLANVKLAVKFDDAMAFNYPDGYYAIVRHAAIKKKNIRFNAKESRCGYIPAGELILEVYAKHAGEWKYFAAPAAEYKPQDFVTFTVSAVEQNGSLNVGILVDSDVDKHDEAIEILSTDIAPELPRTYAMGFADGVYEIDAQDIADGKVAHTQGVSMSYNVPGEVVTAMFTTVSDVMADFPASVDLADMSAEEKAAFDAAGFFLVWDGYDGAIDFASVIPYMAARSKSLVAGDTIATFTLTVTDALNYTSSTTVTFKVK